MEPLQGSAQIFFKTLTLPDEIPHSSRCAGSIRNDISFLHGRGTDVAVRLANRHICPYNSLNALSFRPLARNLPLPLPITFGVIPERQRGISFSHFCTLYRVYWSVSEESPRSRPKFIIPCSFFATLVLQSLRTLWLTDLIFILVE